MGTRRVSRSAKTGKFIKKSAAKNHPSTTITQTVKIGRKRRKRKK